MNCNCKKELEEKLTQRFKEQNPEAAQHGCVIGGYGLALVGNRMEQRGFMEVKSTAKFPLKKGGIKEKTLNQSMFFSYCPFCGVSATGETA